MRGRAPPKSANFSPWSMRRDTGRPVRRRADPDPLDRRASVTPPGTTRPLHGVRYTASVTRRPLHASGFLQRIVARHDLGMALPEMFGEAFGNVHGAMLAAGATYGDGQVAAVGLGEFGDSLRQKVDERREHAIDARVTR